LAIDICLNLCIGLCIHSIFEVIFTARQHSLLCRALY